MFYCEISQNSIVITNNKITPPPSKITLFDIIKTDLYITRYTKHTHTSLCDLAIMNIKIYFRADVSNAKTKQTQNKITKIYHKS